MKNLELYKDSNGSIIFEASSLAKSKYNSFAELPEGYSLRYPIGSDENEIRESCTLWSEITGHLFKCFIHDFGIEVARLRTSDSYDKLLKDNCKGIC